MSSYETITNLGSDAFDPINDPLRYCVGSSMKQSFEHGGSAENIIGQQTRQCQQFLSRRCANDWDGVCELVTKNQETSLPVSVQNTRYNHLANHLTAGDMVLHNTAAKKYLVQMLGGYQVSEPFDPNVANPPMVSKWVLNDGSSEMVPVYAVNPHNIDNDPVMNRLLDRPYVAKEILINIYNTMKRQGTLARLKGTKLGRYYNSKNF